MHQTIFKENFYKIKLILAKIFVIQVKTFLMLNIPISQWVDKKSKANLVKNKNNQNKKKIKKVLLIRTHLNLILSEILTKKWLKIV